MSDDIKSIFFRLNVAIRELGAYYMGTEEKENFETAKKCLKEIEREHQ